MEKIRVLVNGANGRMGKETVSAISNDAAFELVASCNHDDDLEQAIKNSHAQIVIDFTAPQAVYDNTKKIINANAHPVIGTTGLSSQQIAELQELAAAKKLGGIIAPNFCIGALLMMRFAAEAANYFAAVEIIELHHDNKKDAPSGTAIKTAEMIAKNRKQIPIDKTETENPPGSRGGVKDDIHIHSIRLPGFVAHQEVIFSGPGECLTIRHDSIQRSAYMPGVLLACKKVLELEQLVYGLNGILFD